MYCVLCGVKLQDGAKECPLCNTPVLFGEDAATLNMPYSDKYPDKKKGAGLLSAIFATLILISICLGSLVFCLKTYGRAYWSSLVMLGIACFFVVFIFPQFVRFKNSIPYIVIDYFAFGGYLLFINGYTDGDWFLSFAFPVLGIFLLLTLAAVISFGYTGGSKLLKAGILLIAFGCSFMLIELFMHITFDVGMFVWSLYPVCVLGAIGIFLIIARLIPSLRQSLSRIFFY